MRTATITFHASHNYGSMLQAYALQQTLVSLGIDNDIINLRIDSQKQMYSRPVVKAEKILMTGSVHALQRKYDLFEAFLAGYLKLTKEINVPEELSSIADEYDLFIAGSDQIWNPECRDFTFAYYLPFAERKISYATSFGPHGSAVWENAERIASELVKYKSVSVREQGSADIVKSICGIEPEILADPVTLLDRSRWEALAGDSPVRKGEYIFTYHPYPRHGFVNLSQNIGKKLGMKNVTSLIRTTVASSLHHAGFEKELACGPLEFLNLIRNSSLVISGSFHAVLFSIIFERPFFAVCGRGDNRISHLLKLTGLEDRAIDESSYPNKITDYQNIDFSQSREVIMSLREKGIDFLKHNCTI